MNPANPKLDDAARAAWLAYIGGKKQDEIAAIMGISRQSAQRLVSQAMAAGLVKVRIDHPIAACMELAAKVRDEFGLSLCEVVPAVDTGAGAGQGVPFATADIIEGWLRKDAPQVIGIGTGRTLRRAVEQLPHITCDQHKVVSLTGNITPDGSTAYYNVLFTISDKVTAATFPIPLPVIATSTRERDALLGQTTLTASRALAQETDVRFVGIGPIHDRAPLLLDGFMTQRDLERLQAKGAVGEIIGWVYDASGQMIEDEINTRVSSAQLTRQAGQSTIACAYGLDKVNAIRGALRSGLLSGLVTDEATAAALT